MIRTVQIGDQEVVFKSSAAIPHIYRRKFGRDIFLDMDNLLNNINKKKDGGSDLTIESLEMFEDFAYCLAKHADPSIPDNVEDWLERFETFDIYNILPQLVAMWAEENVTTGTLKKKNAK